jgi:anti-sigma factor RsiW
MHCAQAVHQLQLYVDSRLTVQQIRALEAHVAGCAACQKELALVEEVAQSIHNLKFVAEPEDLTARIIRRVALDSRRRGALHFSLLHLSLLELLTAVLLATIATIGSVLSQPSVRALLPFANGHDAFSLAFMDTLQALAAINTHALILACWVIGTVLGICITLLLAGDEMRAEWIKAVTQRLPVR